MKKINDINEITINFGKINPYILLVVIFFVALIIGWSGYTDVYEKFHHLPDNRNELTPIKKITVSILDGSELFVRVYFDAIAKLTIENFYNNINARVEYKNASFFIYVRNSDSNSVGSEFFDFSYRLPLFENNVSVQLFLIDTPINKIQYFDITRKETNDDSHSYTSINQNSFSNVCLRNDKMQVFFKGNPEFNIRKPQIPVFQDNNDFSSIQRNSDFFQEEAILLYNNHEELNQDYFFTVTSTISSYLNDDAGNIKKFLFNIHDTSIFQNIFDFNNAFSGKMKCFSNLKIINPSFDSNTVIYLKNKIYQKLKSNPIVSEKEDNIKPIITYFSNKESTIHNRDDLFQTICPNCEINTISTSKDFINESDLYKIANSKVIIGVHSKLFITAISMQNTNQNVIIDILPQGFQECGNWIKNMKEIARTIIYSVPTENRIYGIKCNKEECNSEVCRDLLKSNFYLDSAKIQEAINLSSNGCPSNVVMIDQNDVFCLNE